MDGGLLILDQARGGLEVADNPEGRVHDIQQYQNIIRFRDVVLSGQHPTVKLPPGLLPSRSPSQPKSAGTLLNGQSPQAGRDVQSAATNPLALNETPSTPSQDTTHFQHQSNSANVEFHPIFLEKSDMLRRAELQLQRQRLERALKEDVDQRRGLKVDKVEPLTDFDLSDVLSKALTLVQATSAPVLSDTNLTATNEAASDSFDDNTFYSSRHDTPESRLASRVQNESDDAGDYEPTESQPVVDEYAALQYSTSNRNTIDEGNVSNYGISVMRPHSPYAASQELDPTRGDVLQVPGLNNYPIGASASANQHNSSGYQSISDDSGQMDMEQPNIQKDARQHIDDVYIHNHPPSPLVQAHHNQMHVMAPSPAQASPITLEEEPTRVPTSNTILPTTRAPAQVAALRNEKSAATSPESSPQTGKKKNRKKKRKLDRQAPEEVMPYIKPEPRSHSPVTAPAYIRPNKRQKQAQRQAIESGAEDLAIIRGPQSPPQPFEPRPLRPGQVDYGSTNGYSQRSVTTAAIPDPRYGREFIEDRRLPTESYPRVQPSPPRYIQHTPSMSYSARPVLLDEAYPEQPRAYRELPEAPRVSMRPEGDPYGPARPTARIVVDSFGREYIDPTWPPMRQSVAPVMHHGEQEMMYERPLPRAPSRHPGPPAFDDASVVYARAPSAYPMPRRVVTQPEYAHHDYNGGRPREYSARPLGPPAEYMQVMAPPERLPAEAPSAREYAPRAVSVRPVEPMRYEMPHEHGRLQSLRPEGPGREHAGPGHIERHREVMQPYVMNYGARPAEPPVAQRGYSVRPVERYYETPQHRGGEGVTYIERPREATHEIVYADNVRHEVYR